MRSLHEGDTTSGNDQTDMSSGAYIRELYLKTARCGFLRSAETKRRHRACGRGNVVPQPSLDGSGKEERHSLAHVVGIKRARDNFGCVQDVAVEHPSTLRVAVQAAVKAVPNIAGRSVRTVVRPDE